MYERDVIAEEIVDISFAHTVVVEGIFLQRPEWRFYFDYVIYLDCPRKVRYERVLNRDTYLGDPTARLEKYKRRYWPGEDLYLRDVDPKRGADISSNPSVWEDAVVEIGYSTEDDVEQRFEVTTEESHIMSNLNYIAEGLRYRERLNGDARSIHRIMNGWTYAQSIRTEDGYIGVGQDGMKELIVFKQEDGEKLSTFSFDASPPLVEVFDATKNQTIIDRLELWETMVLIEFNLKVGTLIDSTIVQIAPIQFGKQLVEELMKATGEVQAAPEPVKAQPQVEAPKPQPQAQQPAQSVAPRKSMPEVAVSQAEFMPFQSTASQEAAPANLGLLYDVPLNVTVELGRTKKTVREVLELSQGSIIELDKLAGEPVDIYVNQQRIARGEVVVIEENFGVRVTEIIQPHERIGIV